MGVTAGANNSVYLGTYVDSPSPEQAFGTVRESEFGRNDFGDDETLECGHVGEDEDVNLTFDGVQLEPDNYDCTKHDLAEATPTTGTLHNCPQSGKWAISVWDGPDGVADDEDDNSLVLKASLGDAAFLLTADIGADGEAYLLGNHADLLHAPVLKVAHHGSRTSTSTATAVLRAILPLVIPS